MEIHQDTKLILTQWIRELNRWAVSSDPAEVNFPADQYAHWLMDVEGISQRIRSFQIGYFKGICRSRGHPIPTCLSLSEQEFIDPLADVEAFSSQSLPPAPDHVRNAIRSIMLAERNGRPEAYEQFGRLTGLMWRAINLPENLLPATEAIFSLASSIRELDERKEISLADKSSVTVVDCCGSGKRYLRMPSLSTASSFVVAYLADELKREVIIAKSCSSGTTNVGSADALAALGFPALLNTDRNLEVAQQYRLSFWRCEHFMPNFARLYHGCTFAPTVLSLCAPAVLSSPVRRDRIIYGLTAGPVVITARVLARLFPDSHVLVISGRDAAGDLLIDEPSPWGPSLWAQGSPSSFITGTWQPHELFPAQYTLSSSYSNVTISDLLDGNAPDELLRLVAVESALILSGDEFPTPPKDLAERCYNVLGSGGLLEFIARARTLASAP